MVVKDKKDFQSNVYSKKTYFENAMTEILRDSKGSRPDKVNNIITNTNFTKMEQDIFKEKLRVNAISKFELAKIDRAKQIDKLVNKELKREKSLKNSDVKKIGDQLIKNADKKDPLIVDADAINREDVRSQVLKAVYITMVEEYNRLRTEVNRELDANGEINTSSKIYNEYLLYENYIRKVDEQYKNINHKYIVLEDETVKKQEDKLERGTIKSEIKIQEKVSDTLGEVKKINKKINDEYNKVVKINDKFENGLMDRGLYDLKIYECSKNIASLKLEIDNMSPQIQDVKQYKKDVEEYKNAKYDIVGVKREEFIDNKTKKYSDESKLEKKDEVLDKDIDNEIEEIKRQGLTYPPEEAEQNTKSREMAAELDKLEEKVIIPDEKSLG